uniref:Holliday junction resolvase n=1 Tax=Pithovirus LCPAC406 TaxID=2506599 RepID=A0A481ZFD9_9VIRU|nr:MAG: holliday junction resolvase [Pithovirus LCPAC406]
MTYYPHTPEYKLSNEINIISIDPGTTSMAISVEKWIDGKYSSSILLEIWNVGPSSKDISVILTDLIKKLDEYLTIIKTCTLFLVERQSFGIKMARVCERLITYFIMLNLGMVVELSPKIKHLGKPRKTKAKQWVIDKTITLLENRNDNTFEIVTMKSRKQKEDLCDAIFQLNEFMRLYYKKFS